MKSSIVRALWLSFIMIIAGAHGALAQDQSTGPMSDDEVYQELNLFGEIFDRIRDEYVDAPNERELVRAAIQGMLTSLDPHSGYLDPNDFEDVREDTQGTFGGLGIEVIMENEVIRVVSPIDETPAARAGVLAGDLIVELDGVEVRGLSLDQAVDKMRGEIGTDIELTIVREGRDDPLNITITRDIITFRVVRTSVRDNVGVIRLARFTGQAYAGIEDGIRELRSEMGDDMKGLVLDLRNNPGGLVDQAVYIADAFLARGNILSTRGRTDDENTRYDANPDDLDKLIADIPLIVLINGGSASASEIVAGALQDQQRATLLGTRSFGKGSVQSIIPLGENGAMRLTTSRYYTPSGRSIQAAGITPDIEIFQDVPEELQGRDLLIGEAALDGHIDGGTEKEATTGSSVFVPADPDKDNQLKYAVDLINGVETNEAFPPKADN
ncbi:S41 family peptidase [Maritalea porphyrae]|jgi:carboxyl-terminal processing protease|uniref:S41 family peptidase n=1 Tax=uncultured Maritalea sp. TaxID=757249 RepID=UPI0022B05CD8|nr:S41 family peptidase [Maritalea porphyrae]MCZ4271661.1 S41 family peptidase [Maritalea porphyrae]